MHSLFSFTLSVTRPFLRYFVGLMIVALGWSVVVNAQPFLIKLIIDHVTTLKKEALFQAVLPLIICYVLIGVGFILLFRFYDFIIASFIPRQKEYIALKLMNRMMHHSASFYQKHFAGNLTNKINDVILQTPEIIKSITDKFATALCTLAVVLINMGLVQPRFAAALSIWLAIFLGGGLWMLFSNSRYAYAAAESRSQVIGHIVDMLMNVVSIRLFARARFEKKMMRGVTSVAVEQEKARDWFFMKLHFFQGVSFLLYEGVCFWWLLMGISQGSITPGGFVLIFTLNLQILDQFWDLGREIREFWEKIGHMKQALSVIYAPEEAMDFADDKALVVPKGSITFNNVTFLYPGGSPLFQDQTIKIEPKQKIGLVGYSGSGKSTFMSLILRLYDVNSGEILIDGQNIQHVSRDSLYESIAVVPQECYLFNRTLMENIRYGRLDATDSEVFEAAEKAQIHNVILQLPQGYETFAGEKGMRLSGGQRQRVVIARAILKNAPILLMDEATSNLDSMTEDKIKKAFEEVMKDKTVIVIAHRISTLESVDRILVLENGKIIQDGSHARLIQEGGLYQELWRAQSQHVKVK